MCNFSYKNIGSTPNTNEMKTILKPKLPYLYSKLLEACALFGCSHISGYIQLSLNSTTFTWEKYFDSKVLVTSFSRNFTF